MNVMETSTPQKGRPYKSRKSRPCDACRRRKVTCDMPTGPPCRRCSRIDHPCTFNEGPGPRKRPALAGLQVAFQQCAELLPEGSNDYLYTPAEAPPMQFETEGTMNALTESPSSTASSASLSRRDSLDSPCIEGSLEFVPGAFTFYIGPTGVSDVHLLSREYYNEQLHSSPRVSGLRYRLMNPVSRYNPASHTIFGVTDHALIHKAEPKVDARVAATAWTELWTMLSPTAAWHLVHLYARYIDPYYPVLSRHQVPATPDTLSNMPLALLTAICATTLPFIMYDEALYTLLLHPPSARDLYRLCWLGITQDLHAPSMSTLQACLILQQRLPTNLYLSDTAFTWSLMSTAVAVANTIGLHRDPSSWTSLPAWERRLRRRLWWGLWLTEKWIAFTRGMPSHIREDEYDVPMLSISDTDDILDLIATHSCPEMTSYLLYLTLLTGILADIQQTYYTVRAVARTSTDLEYSLDAARSTRARLKDWRDRLPDSFKRRPYPTSSQNSGSSPQDLDGSGSLYLSYIVTHMSLFRALLRPLDAVPTLIAEYTDSANAVIKGALLCVKEFVEFIESLTGAQWNSFWHSWSRPNFAVAGAFMVHLLHIVSSPSASGFSDEYDELQGWIRRWRWVNRISANGAAGVKGLTNLGVLKVETLLGSLAE
ncbi:fungal-specific transcription factor domain-containing protein [Aspergillus pseudoustus]|uniref:Fungal-specific transcription factor domain-containing protein n=1 Tax=Aspergillus pseudoustus TaxID=1810923 RepID=A0ABR4J5X8_9EURO